MAGKYGTAKNGCSVGAFYSGFETRSGGTEARITSAKVRFKNTTSISDVTNSWEWGGTAVSDGSRGTVSLSGTGERDIQTGITATWVALGYPGTTVTRTFTAKGKDVEYAGGDITVSVSIEYPDRPWQAPAAVTSLTVTRVNDNQQNLSWTNNATGTAPYGNIRIKRRLGTGSYATIATVASSATSYADKSTVSNAKYDYIVEAYNSTAAAPSSAVGISTTPAAPTNVTISKSGTTITSGWTDNSPYETGFRVERNEDGGAYTLLTTTAANATSAQQTGANAAVTHRHRIAALAAGGLQSAWLYTNTVALQAPPNAPMVSVPATIDATTTVLVISFLHRPTDATVQTSAEVRWRAIGAPTWTTVSKTTQTTHSIAAETLSNGVDYEAQVRTKGAHATFGAWSASVIVRARTRPITTIGGSGGTVTTTRYNLPWTYYQAESEPQQAWMVELWRDGVRLEQREGSGATAAVLLNTVLVDDATYTVYGRTLSASGLWSDWDTDTFTVEFLPPPTPIVSAVFDPDTGATEVLVTVPAAEVPTEARRNLITNPVGTPILATSGWELNARWFGTSPSAGAISTVTAAVTLPDGTEAPSYRRKTWSNVSGPAFADVAWQFFYASSNRAPVTAGTLYALQFAWRRSWSAAPTQCLLAVSYFTAVSGGSQVGSTQYQTVTAPPANTWQQDHLAFTPPTGATHCEIYLRFSATPGDISIGSTMDATAVCVEQADQVRRPFWGSYSPDASMTPAWVGAANASASTLTTLGTAEPVSVDIYRDGAVVASELAVPDEGQLSVIDPIPPLGQDITYQVVTWSAIPSSAEATVTLSTRSRWIILTGGPGWTVSAKVLGDVDGDFAASRAKVLRRYAGRRKPVEHIGPAREVSVRLTGVVALHETGREADRLSTWAAWLAVTDLPAPICYRNGWDGERRFVSIGETTRNLADKIVTVSASLTEVDGSD